MSPPSPQACSTADTPKASPPFALQIQRARKTANRSAPPPAATTTTLSAAAATTSAADSMKASRTDTTLTAAALTLQVYPRNSSCTQSEATESAEIYMRSGYTPDASPAQSPCVSALGRGGTPVQFPSPKFHPMMSPRSDAGIIGAHSPSIHARVATIMSPRIGSHSPSIHARVATVMSPRVVPHPDPGIQRQNLPMGSDAGHYTSMGYLDMGEMTPRVASLYELTYRA
eukprot:CAMPEP_0179429788 /NCGR_PEP_ID=MMETSP0799-20121207/15070_1 /TAXON_ID=46947 /ORGANISM="Geminigera cryophila, Strain CCMP2564" /LENGTH=228 /DNA_ID=CAMNT_0021205853 /DNA_START=657 /DNA_END=1343 /DNA_ORIENTATION=-